MNGRILEQDIADFVDKCSYWENLRGKRIAVTGATGLIGSIMIKCLDALNRKHGLGITIYGIARNIDKAKDMFPADVNVISFADFANLEKCLPESKLHYIIHAAAPTASDFFKKKPVETFDGVVGLTRTVLGRAKDLHCESMVLLSSLEFYGEIQDDTQYVTEDCQGYINPLNARSSYSMGKRAAECLCYAFYSEFQIPVKIARLAQTFGAGVAPDDKRVFAYIARLAMGGGGYLLQYAGRH